MKLDLAPTHPHDLVNKQYVDEIFGGGKNRDVNLLQRLGEITESIIEPGGSFYDGAQYKRNAISIHRIAVYQGEKYQFTKNTVKTDGYWRVMYLDSNGEFLSRFANASNNFTEQIPVGACFMVPNYPMDAKPSIKRIY